MRLHQLAKISTTFFRFVIFWAWFSCMSAASLCDFMSSDSRLWITVFLAANYVSKSFLIRSCVVYLNFLKFYDLTLTFSEPNTSTPIDEALSVLLMELRFPLSYLNSELWIWIYLIIFFTVFSKFCSMYSLISLQLLFSFDISARSMRSLRWVATEESCKIWL